MSRLRIALFVTAGLGFAGVTSAQTTYAQKTSLGTSTLTKDGYAQAKKDADEQYKRDKAACASLSGNVWQSGMSCAVCLAA